MISYENQINYAWKNYVRCEYALKTERNFKLPKWRSTQEKQFKIYYNKIKPHLNY